MKANDANLLRAAILRLERDGLTARQIARRLGCHRSTVYKVLERREPDRRTRKHRPRRAESPLAARLLAALEDGGGARARVSSLARPRPESGGDGGEEPPADPYADVVDGEYALTRSDGAVGPETALVRLLLRDVLRELREAPGEGAARARLRKEVGELLLAFVRLQRMPAGEEGREIVERLRLVLERAPTEVGDGRGEGG